MKHLKRFNEMSEFKTSTDSIVDRNEILNILKEHDPEYAQYSDVKDVPDNRESAEVGDTAIAIWFPDEEWYMFTVESLDTADDDFMGLGFDGGSSTIGNDDTVYDIGAAYHVIILKK